MSTCTRLVVNCIAIVLASTADTQSRAAVITLADLPKTYDESDATPLQVTITDALWNIQGPNVSGYTQLRLYDDPAKTQLSDVIVFGPAPESDGASAPISALLRIKIRVTPQAAQCSRLQF